MYYEEGLNDYPLGVEDAFKNWKSLHYEKENSRKTANCKMPLSVYHMEI